MAPVTFNVTPESDEGRVRITAAGGEIGEAFYLARRDSDGIVRTVRETTDASKVWQRDPAGARSNFFMRPSFETVSLAQTIAVNLYRNPKMLAQDTPIASSMRTNLARNPSFEIEGAAVAEPGNGAVTLTQRFGGGFAGNAYLRATWTKPGNVGAGGIFSNTFPVVVGRTYTVSAYVRTSGLKTMRVRIEFNNSAGSWFGAYLGTPISVRAYSTSNTGWTRISATVKAPVGAVSAIPCMYLDPNSGSRFLTGDWMELDAVLSEETDTVKDYFDGQSGAGLNNLEGLRKVDWVGDPHNSASRIYSRPVYELFGRNCEARDWPGAAGIYPTGTSNDTSVTLGTGDTGAMRSGLVAGRTYNVSATLKQTAIQTGTLHANARKIVAFTRVGTGSVVSTASEAKPNAIGSERLELTFSVPEGATEAYVRIYSGAARGTAPLLIESVMLIESDVALPYFDGDTANASDLSYEWLSPTAVDGGNLGGSAIQAAIPSGGFASSNVYSVASTVWKAGGKYSLRQIPNSNSTNAYTIARSAIVVLEAGKTYTVRAEQYQTQSLTGTLHSSSRKIRISGTGMSDMYSPSTPNEAGRRTIWFTFTVPAGATGVALSFMHGGTYGSGDLWWDLVMVTEGKYASVYFDGNSVTNSSQGGWTGTAHASTSVKYSGTMPITVYDYEAQQGDEVEYLLLDQQRGIVTGSSSKTTLPTWGTWLKDPLRPYLNVKVALNDEGNATHAANRVLLQPRGARNVIAQWDARSAPFGSMKFLTMDREDRRKLLDLIEQTGVIFVDAPAEFEIFAKYVSIGDVVGSRPVSGRLSAAARLWEFQVDEVIPPVGETVGMAATYENVALGFSSYIALAASVEDYRSLVAGGWN